MTLSSIFLLFGVYAFLMHSCSGQKLKFPYGVTYHEKQNHVGNWSIDGSIEMSESDFIMFDPKLEINMCSPMCTIDLSKCSIDVDEQKSPNSCYCTKTSGDEVNVHVGSLARPAHSGLVIQAVLPSKTYFQPVSATQIIGKVPTITESIVSFNKVPNDVQIGLTQTMKVRCEVKRHRGKPKYVTSMAINRNGGERIAEVSDSGGAKAFTDFSNVNVTGEVSKKTVELAYIELTWLYPTRKQIGVYQCEVNAVDSTGQAIDLSSTLEVGISAPTIDEVVKRIQDLDNEKETTLQKMKTTLDKMSNRIRVIESDKKSIKSELDEMKKSNRKEFDNFDKLASQDNKILKDLTSLKSKVTKNSTPRHVESGRENCGNAKQWAKINTHYLGYEKHNHSSLLRNMTIKFNQPYDKPPIVLHGIDHVDTDHRFNARYSVIMDKIDRYGFTVLCSTWDDSIVYGINFSWLSLSSDE